ncbi:MAG: ATP-binding protein, partial [Chloroflexi bacterium]|nr:ATP-binding protein [Chloroflexota bacterium]
MLKRLVQLLLEFGAGLAGNLAAGWIQQDVWSNLFTPARLVGTFLGAGLMLFVLALLESDWLQRKKQLRELQHAFQRITAANSNEQATQMALLGSLPRAEVNAIIQCLKNQLAVLLVGEAGSGKTGIIVKLVKEFESKAHPVLLLRADGFPRNATTMDTIESVLPLRMRIVDSLRIMAEARGATTLVIDQLDSVGGTDLCRLLCALLQNARTLPGVMVIGVSRTYDAKEREEIRGLGFSQVESEPLGEERARVLLTELGISEHTEILVALAQNFLNLSLIAELAKVGINVTGIDGEVELWNLYRGSIEKREGVEALGQAVQIAQQALQSGQREFPLPIAPDNATRKLLSRGILIKVRGARYRFRHERIQDYLYAWDGAMRRRLLPDQVLRELPESNARGILKWMHLMYHKDMPDMEPTFVRRLLNVEQRAGFYTRVVALDVLREQRDPSPETVEVLVQALSDESYCRYFFRDLGNPAWLPVLKAAGLFSEPPQPIEAERGLYKIPPWEASKYLVRVAGVHPGPVVEIALRIETENVHIYHDLLQAGMKMPPDKAARMVPAVVKWLRSRFMILIPKHVGDFMVYLAEGDQWDGALELLELLTEPMIEQLPESADEAIRLFRPSEAKPRFEKRVFEDLLKTRVPRLAERQPFTVLEVLEAQLVKAIEYAEQAGLWKRGADGSILWRSAIEDHPQNSSIRNIKELLAEAIRDLLQEVAADDDARQIIERYLDHQYSIFRRLAIHVVRLHPKHYGDLLISLFSERANLDDPNIHHEFYLLMESAFDKAPSEVQRQLLEWIVEGEPPERLELSKQRYKQHHGGAEAPDNLVRSWKEYWTLTRLRALRNQDLPAEYKSKLDTLVATLGEPEHPSFLMYTTVSWSGAVSPKSKEDLLAMAPEEVLEYLRQYVQPQDPLAPSLEGLLNVFRAVVQERAEEYATLAQRFLESGVRPVYMYHLLWALEEAWKADRSFDWGPLLTFCEEVVQRGGEEQGEQPRTSFETSYAAAQGQVANLLREAVRRDDHTIPQEHMPRVRDILLRLLHHPDPTPEYEQQYGGDNMDPATLSLNTVRGKAMHALIAYALRRARLIDSQTQLEEGGIEAQRLESEVREALTQKLDKTRDPSLAVHSIFGQYLSNLYYLDREWLTEHLPGIFPTEAERRAYWRAAWNSYISFNPLYSNLYGLLRVEYRRAVEQLPEKTEGRAGFERANESLAEHLMIAYWRGLEEVEG